MLTLSIKITGEVEEFINRASHLYGASQESVACDLIAKGYDPEGKIKGVDISKGGKDIYHRPLPPKDKPARSA